MKGPRIPSYYGFVVMGTAFDDSPVAANYVCRAVSQAHGETRARSRYQRDYGWTLEQVQFVGVKPYRAAGVADAALDKQIREEQRMNCDALLADCATVQKQMKQSMQLNSVGA